jgi:hypothetical protein
VHHRLLPQIHALVLSLSLAACAGPPAPPPKPLPPLDLPGAEFEAAFVSRVGNMDCKQLRRAAGKLDRSFAQLGPYGADGDAVKAVARRTLGCDETWAALLLFRYLPHLSIKRWGNRASRESLQLLAAPENRAASLTAFKRMLVAADGEITTGVSDDAWWLSKDDLRVEELLAPTCTELTDLRLGSDRAYDAARRLLRRRGCSLVPAHLAALAIPSSEARAHACSFLELDAKGALPEHAGHAVARAATTDPGEPVFEPNGQPGLKGLLMGPVEVRRDYLAAARCGEVAMRIGGIYISKVHYGGQVTFDYYGGLREITLELLDVETGRASSNNATFEVWRDGGWRPLVSGDLTGPPRRWPLRATTAGTTLPPTIQIRLRAVDQRGRAVIATAP